MSRGAWLAAGLAALTVLVSAAPRLALAAGTLPDAARPLVWSDVLATYETLLSGGRLPYRDTFFDYPPVVGYVAALFTIVAAGPVAYVALWTAVSALGAAAVALLLARGADARDVILFWSCSPQLLLYGASNVDVVPVALVVAAVVLARAGRGTAAMVALAVGTATKIFPVVVAPVELDRSLRERGPAAAMVAAALFGIIVIAISLPSLLAPFPSTEGVLHQAGRTNVDSVWGIALGLLEGIGVPDAGRALGILAATGFVLTYALLVLPAARRSTDPARGALLAVLALLLWSRLFSPQYTLWVLPFFVLLGIGLRRYALLSTADVVVFASVYPLSLVRWPAGEALPVMLLGVLAAAVVLRHVALILIWRDVSRPDMSAAGHPGGIVRPLARPVQ